MDKCYNCIHYIHLYDDDELHTLDDNTDYWYEPISVFGCSLEFDGFDCHFQKRDDVPCSIEKSVVQSRSPCII